MGHVLSTRSGRGAAAFTLLLVGCILAVALAAGPAAAVMNNEQYGFLNQIGGPGTGAGQFGGGASPGPYGVAVDSAGNVFAVDPNNSGYRVHKFAPDGTHLTSFGAAGSGDGHLSGPYGIAIAPNGVVYVVDTWRADADRVQYYASADGGATYASAGHIAVASAAGESFQIAADGLGNVYVTQVASGVHQVLKYRVSDEALLATIGASGSDDDLLSAPRGVAVSADGSDLYVADGARVKRLHGAGGTSYAFAQAYGDGLGLFAGPWGVALDSAGALYVTDTTLDKVVKFSAAGDVVTSWGTNGAGNEQFRGARAVAVGSTGCVYVADTGWAATSEHPEYGAENHRVMRYARDLTPPTSIVTGLPSGWTNAAQVALAFSGTDPVVTDEFSSGYQFTQLLIGASWFAHSGDYVVGAEGVTTVHYRATDWRNNDETDQSLDVRIDRTKPTITASAIPAGWSKTPVPVTFGADDALSGVARTEYSTNGGATWTAAASVTIPARGPTTLSYRSVDNAGNAADTQTAAVLADSVKPAPKPLADVSVKRGKTARLRYRVTDRACPQAKVWIELRKGGKTRKTLSLGPRATGRDLTFSWKCTLGKGTYTWAVFATDLAGNAQARTLTKKLMVR